ncbi:MAG: hypothetical protein D6808_07710 [Candidatus Dadabacteria bacterium]|nr:MAG: hypothetical protein D6808_07710 [Candidatus Dadabacteria bacterium]
MREVSKGSPKGEFYGAQLSLYCGQSADCVNEGIDIPHYTPPTVSLRPAPDPSKVSRIALRHGFSSPLAPSILAVRGFEPESEALERFLNPTLATLPDPFRMLGFRGALEEFLRYAQSKRPIFLMGDYDCDGITSVLQVHHFSLSLGIKTVPIFPVRSVHGFGMHKEIIAQALAKHGPGLIITFDYGIKNNREIEYAKSLGFKVVVFDHHYVGESRCNADYVVCPGQSGCGFEDNILCSSGLAYLFVSALRERLNAGHKVDMGRYLELSALGTIADMVPLLGTNRAIVKGGLEHMSSTSWPVFSEILRIQRGAPVWASDVAFGLQPHINAVGRLGDVNQVAMGLLTSDMLTALEVSEKLDTFNLERQSLERSCANDVLRDLGRASALPDVIVRSGTGFHPGVVGIVCSRLVELYRRPALLFAEKDGVLTGSGRSIPGFNLIEALCGCSDLFLKFGGHPAAVGATLVKDNLPQLQKALSAAFCMERSLGKVALPAIEVDLSLSLQDITPEGVLELYRLDPFGVGNPPPVVRISGLCVERKDRFGTFRDHTSFVLTDGSSRINGVQWHWERGGVRVGDRVTAVGTPVVSRFSGQVELDIEVLTVE